MALNKEIKSALADRLEGWEIVEFLQLPVELVVEVFEEEIEENLEDILDFANLREYNRENDNNNE